jgi:hypothetical protein
MQPQADHMGCLNELRTDVLGCALLNVFGASVDLSLALCTDAQEDLGCLLAPSSYPKSDRSEFELAQLQQEAMVDLYRKEPQRASAIEEAALQRYISNKTASIPSSRAIATPSSINDLAALRLLVDARCAAGYCTDDYSERAHLLSERAEHSLPGRTSLYRRSRHSRRG